ncbi:transcription activator effector binding protein [Hyphomicrobium denitrificans 1NES1]|uniref:Transcription activator effector binding protein n=1 Tax=Hyphomicrobium denitrificans 1NES1 TaxID=670307 RepID=N0B6M5_9HYPH|nr:GyrI-like domain-containing protein [Hyphomicrobium denitrificans]AGK59254.1 transcription activator effector binding protein [Hyphomicrobium denitrificans 1NES1]
MDNPHSILLYLRPTRLIYVRARGCYVDMIPKAWNRLFQLLDANGLYASLGRGYGLAHDNPLVVGPQNCRYDACVEIRSGLEERSLRAFGITTLQGGAYARRRLSGSYDHMRSAVQDVYSEFTPLPGLCFDENRPVVSIYVDNPNCFAERDLRSDICVPVIADDESIHPRLAVSA